MPPCQLCRLVIHVGCQDVTRIGCVSTSAGTAVAAGSGQPGAAPTYVPARKHYSFAGTTYPLLFVVELTGQRIQKDR
jgi:hypothetical protein